MERRYREYQRIIASVYLLLILALLPIYMRDGLTMIGDAKYFFYRNASIVILPLWVLGIMVMSVSRWWKKRELLPQEHFSATDFCAVGFAVVSCLSYLFSAYKDTALRGYSGWYMGLLTQLALVGGYFLVSRWYEGERVLAGCVWLSAFVVCLAGVLNRMGNDPLRVYGDMSWWEWNRRNLLSTIGNINWFCSYLAVMVPFLIYCFWAGRGYWRLLEGIGAFVGIAALLLQGSSSGYVALGVMLAILFYGSLGALSKFLRFLETVLLIPLFGFFMWLFLVDLILPFDVSYHYTPAWGVVFLAIFAVYLPLRVFRARGGRDFLESGKVRKAAMLAGVVLLVMAAGIFAGCQLSDDIWNFFGGYGILRFDNEWGSMRGQLWRIAWGGFLDGSFVQKLYGVGPDCFGCYFYDNYPMDIIVSGQWQDAVYANAHNEWLNMLNNEGILGFTAYAGFFATAFYRFRKRYGKNRKLMAGLMAVGAYVANNFFSFGQVVSTPLVFLVIAVCENVCRKTEHGLENDMGESEKKDWRQTDIQKWKILAVVCGVVAVAAAIVTAVLLLRFFGEEMDSEIKMEKLRVRAEAAEESEEPEPEPVPEPTETPETLPENPYAALFRENEDMAAWIVVDGTVIDYPVMQTMEDENYYLNRDFYGNEDKAGCLILDTDSPLYEVEGTSNLIIHGHNMKAGTMFGELDLYKDEDYCQEHKYMQLYTRSEKREYEVIAVFYSQVYYSTDQVFKYYNFFETEDETEFRDFYDNIKKMSLYDTGVEAQLGDQFLTLSTCAYHVEDGRFVVVAKETGREEKYEMP